MTKLHYLVDENGMNLTFALLNTIVKYPNSSLEIDETTGDIKDKKMGFYYADENIYRMMEADTGTNGKRHPLTYILEAADDLAYKTADIEDAFVKGFISFNMLIEEMGVLQEKYPNDTFKPKDELIKRYKQGKERQVSNPEEYAVKNWIVRVQGFLITCATYGFTYNYDAIMAGNYKYDLFHGTFAEELMNLLGEMAFRIVFSSATIYKLEMVEAHVLDYLMDRLVHAAIYYDTEVPLNSIDLRIISFISDNYKNAYRIQAEGKSDAEKLYLRLLLVTDYVCGMTDSYAKRLYQELNVII